MPDAGKHRAADPAAAACWPKLRYRTTGDGHRERLASLDPTQHVPYLVAQLLLRDSVHDHMVALLLPLPDAIG